MMLDPTSADRFMLARCMYLEAAGDGNDAMTAVGCVVRNRANKNGTSLYTEITKRLQFSSITAGGDPGTTRYPDENEPAWKMAQSLATGISMEVIKDNTNGSTMYYAPKALTQSSIAAVMPVINGAKRVFPKGWDFAHVKFQVQVGSQLFFTQVK